MAPKHNLILDFNDLILNASSLVRLETNIYHIALHPSNKADLKSAIKEHLDSVLYKFNSKFGGFLLGYKNVKIASDRGTLINDNSIIHINIIADFYIFAPKVGCVLYGIVNKKSHDHIGCLVHKFFNVSIPRPSKEQRQEWIGSSAEIGHKVTFVLKVCDFTGNLPYMRGSILSSCPVPEDETLTESKKKNTFHLDKLQEETFATTDSQFEEISERLTKRKRESDEENHSKKKKKKKTNQEEDEEKHEESNPLHLSSDDPNYDEIIQHIKESYLKDNVQDEKEKSAKEKGKNKKRKLYLQNEYTENVDETDASEHGVNKKKKRKKQHDMDAELGIVLPDLVSLGKRYKSSSEKLNESLSALETSPSKVPENPTDEPLKKKKKDRDEGVSRTTDSPDLPKKKKKKKKHEKLECLDTGISRIETNRPSCSLQTDSEGTVFTPNEPASTLSRITSVYSDSDNDDSYICNLSEVSPYNLHKANMVNAQDRKRVKLNKGKGDAIPERKSLPLLPSYSNDTEFKSDENMFHRNSISVFENLQTPPKPSSLSVNSRSSNKHKKSVTFEDGDRLLTPEKSISPSDVFSQSFVKTQKSPIKKNSNMKEKAIEDSSIAPQSPTADISLSPKSKKVEIKSPDQNKEEKGEAMRNFINFDLSKVLETLASPSNNSGSTNPRRSKLAAMKSISPSNKISATSTSNINGQLTSDSVETKDKHKTKRKKDKSKLKKKKEKDKSKSKNSKKEKKSKGKVIDKKVKESKKKRSETNAMTDLKKFSDEILKKFIQQGGAS